jgi:hypothetical protein
MKRLPVPAMISSRATVDASWSALAASITASTPSDATRRELASSRSPKTGSMPDKASVRTPTSSRTNPVTS